MQVRSLLAGAGWTYGAQLGTVVFQFGSAAVMSRVATGAQFGAYSVSLLATGLFTLLSTAGLSQTVARIQVMRPRETGAVVTLALLLSVFGGGAVFMLAPLLALMWGNSDSTLLIQILSILAICAPITSATSGILRRLGKFRELAAATFVSNLLGLVVGVLFVVHFRTAWSLVVSNVTAATALMLCGLFLSGGYARPRSMAGHRSLFAFSWRVTASSAFQYLNGNVARFSSAQVVSPVSMGYWNRAEVLSAVPIQQLQTAVLQVLYPEFRHDIGNPHRARRVWTGLLCLLAWTVLPGTVVLSLIVPLFVPIIFGPGWSATRAMITLLMLGGGIQFLAVVIASAVEAIGRFSAVWVANLCNFAGQLGLAAACLATGSVVPALCGAAVNGVVLLTVYGVWSSRSGYLDGTRLMRELLQVLVFCALLAGGWAGVNYLLELSVTVGVIAVSAVVVVSAIAIGLRWRSLPLVRLAISAGLFRGK